MYTGKPDHASFLEFEAGEIDSVMELSTPDYLWLVRNPAWSPHILRAPGMNVIGARMNVTRPPFDDKRVRQALNYAVNKDKLIKVLNGRAEASHGMLPPPMMGYNARLEPYPHDPDKARKLLAEAGYGDGLTVDYATISGNEKITQSMQADLAQVGVEMNIQVMSGPALMGSWGSPGGIPFSWAGWLADYPDPANFFDSSFHSRMIKDEHSTNTSFYSNSELDALLDRARWESDPQVRRQLYEKVEKILYDDAPWIWSHHLAYVEVRQPYVHGPGHPPGVDTRISPNVARPGARWIAGAGAGQEIRRATFDRRESLVLQLPSSSGVFTTRPPAAALLLVVGAQPISSSAPCCRRSGRRKIPGRTWEPQH